MFKALHEYLIYSANVGIYNDWHSILYWLITHMPTSDRNYMVEFSQQQINDHVQDAQDDKQGLIGRRDLLSKALQMHWQDPDQFSMEKVFVTAITSVGAGSDTTSVSLAAIMYYLMRSPAAYQKLRAEIDEKAAAGAASNPITYRESQAMPFLQACIKEGLRLHPATGLPLMRVVPPEGATIAGTFFSGGTTVGINTWVAHYNKSIFGPDAAEFNPERWLEDKDKTSAMDQYYFPFGSGSRTCIGKNISLMEISKLIPELVRHFDFSLLRPDQELETENVWFVKQKNLFCNVALRQY